MTTNQHQLVQCRSCENCAAIECRGYREQHHAVHCSALANEKGDTRLIFIDDLEVCFKHSPKQQTRDEE